MSDAFSIYEPRESGLHRLHPLTKIVLTLCLLTLGLTLPGMWTSYILFGGVVIPLATWGQVRLKLLKAVWNIVLPFAISVLLIQGFFWGQGTPLFTLGPLTLKLEGVLFAVTSIGRILLVVSCFTLLALTTRPDTLMFALTQIGLPASLAYIVAATIQIVPRFRAKASTVIEAQRARGLETEGHMLRRAQALVPLIMPLVLGSLVDVEERAIAIEARAFKAKRQKTSLVELSDSSAQKVLRLSLIVATVLVAGVGLWL
ncbi:MAG TPA: energy-coupling factor transporter transmembrane component T [Anaerolineae bacterium]|nr:energy-coupling factor transporter transmembrane component T [Anaerolineae bacterium]